MSSNDCFKKTSLPYDGFHNWIHCVCVVTFDLELGQAMEIVYPSHVVLSDKEKLNICYLSFPDSNSGCMGDTKFFFRIRNCSGEFKKSLADLQHLEYNQNCPYALQSDNCYYFGFVYFRQMRDKTIRRGYFQKSMVLITRLPFVALFTNVVEIMAPQYFEIGLPSLEAACHNIDQWNSPIPGQTLNLPLSGSIIQVKIPSRSERILMDKQVSISDNELNVVTNQIANIFLPSVHEVDLIFCFQPILANFQLLWELVLTGEQIIVMSSDPFICSSVVQAFVDTIYPLKFAYDYRPYFTIHDSEFKEFTSRSFIPQGVILGVTNPFFVKTLQHWPHIIRIGEQNDSAFFSRSISQMKKSTSQKTLDFQPGVYTSHSCFLKKDKSILKKLLKALPGKRPSEVQNVILRRYLLELTQSFIIPLERYISSLMPLDKNVSPHMDVPCIKSFKIEEFIRTLENSGPQLTSLLKGDWIGLYRKFITTLNFECWFKCRQKEMNQKLKALQIERQSQCNYMEWIVDKKEVQVIDLVLRLRESLNCIQRKEIFIKDELYIKLQQSLNDIISSLPTDLQSVISIS